MKTLKKLAAALAAAAMITSLAGCGESEKAPAQSTTPESKPAPQSAPVSSSAPVNSSAPISSSEPDRSEPPTTPLDDSFPENPSEASLKYYEDAVGVVDKYFSTVMGNYDEVQELGLADVDYEDPEDMEKIRQYLLDCAAKGEGYLDELERLEPTDEMSAFHNGLVKLMSTMRGYSDIAKVLKNVDMTDEKASDDFNVRVEKLFERFNKEYRAFYAKYPGFGKTLAEGKWQENESSASLYFTPDLGEELQKYAEYVCYTVTYWLPAVKDKTPLANATLEIVKTKNGCEITGAALSNKDIEGLKQEIKSFFYLPDGFWARVYLREDGSPSCTLFSPDGKLDDSELNGGEGLSSNLSKWRDTGVTSQGHLIGFFGAPPTSEPQ